MSLSRKQRRLDKKKSSIKKTAAPKNAVRAAQARQEAIRLKAENKNEEALALFLEALSLDSTLADVHFSIAMMARTKPELNIDIDSINKKIKNKNALHQAYISNTNMLRKKRQYKEAVICQEEICRLMPEDGLATLDLGMLLNVTGDYERAICVMSEALLKHPHDKTVKAIYSVSLQNTVFTQFHPHVKEAMNLCFENIYDVHLRHFWNPWINLMAVDPAFKSLNKADISSEEHFYRWADGLDENTAAFFKDKFFTGGLRRLVIANRIMELILTYLRRYICLHYDTLIKSGRIALFEPCLPALAEQCFFNEYIFSKTDEESKKYDALSKTIQNEEKPEMALLSLLACYEPLSGICKEKESALKGYAADNTEFAQLVKTQFEDPLEETRIKEKIEIFGAFANEISRNVQSQYEENPYPRWSTTALTASTVDELNLNEQQRKLPYNILIAGCGTGRQAMNVAVRYPNAKITAIDLSRASIAYAARKTQEAGLENRIRYVNADILSMADWPDEFDMIECSGVLHHMEDPFAGWQVLTEKLKPQSLIKIGLYSETARQPVLQARDFIKEHNFPSTAEGIRACRDMVFDLPDEHPIKQFCKPSMDFYTTSSARDLIFHVQEHQMNLPQIENWLDKLGLNCLRFVLSNPYTIYKYDNLYPEDTQRNNIANWHALEQKDPLIFSGMYQFWCQKRT